MRDIILDAWWVQGLCVFDPRLLFRLCFAPSAPLRVRG